MFKVKAKRALLTATAIVLTGLLSTTTYLWLKKDKLIPDNAQTQADELRWDDLIPDNFQPSENPLLSLSREERDKLFNGSEESIQKLAAIEEQLNYSPVVPELNGKRVKIPGYIVPLEFDEQTELTEFLLVPYFGACIHTPPPPANQIVFARSKTSLQIDSKYDPVWVVGTMRTQT
ncbi:MAG: DUF3299 domain-containing protein, partial [Granulosicoccus sp.]|nr:DUF3299 domain-containing protein [Granulosicoccus sp.]